MVASQIQLREDIKSHGANMKNSQEGDKTDQNSPISESEKKINEKISKMEEMIKRARMMDDLMDYQSLFLFPDVRLPPSSRC